MEISSTATDVRPTPWTGRFDGDGDEHRRWWQAVAPHTPGVVVTGATGPGSRPAVVVGFRSDEGVRRNKGRIGAAAAPEAIRHALGPLAFHLERDVFDAGDVVVEDGSLEAGQERAGRVISEMLDAGNLTVLLGGGHETAFASYLGVAGSEAVTSGKRLGVLNLDAHFDLRDEPVPSSGTPFLQMARAETRTAPRRSCRSS
jgi:formiminoglutamase